MKSAFQGLLREIPGVSVDNFTGENIKSRAFFLSHCHTDHMQGLFGDDLVELLKDHPDIKIYMSIQSASIVRNSCLIEVVTNAVKVLEFGTTHITLPERDDFQEQYVSVAVIPAGHCLGSVMFLFTTCRGHKILYTGDFRIRENDVHKYAQLHKNGEPIPIHTLYIDTTFIGKEHDYFPKRSDCIEELAEHLKKWLAKGEKRTVGLSFSAKYGYEFVMVELYQRLKHKIYIGDRTKLKIYSDLKFAAVTDDSKSTPIHECRYGRCDHGDAPSECMTVRLSAWSWRDWEYGCRSPVKLKDSNRLEVCFATHCSSSEIRAFVDYYQPRHVVGFPHEYTRPDLVSAPDHSVKLTPPRRTPIKRTAVQSPWSAKRDRGEKVGHELAKKLFS